MLVTCALRLLKFAWSWKLCMWSMHSTSSSHNALMSFKSIKNMLYTLHAIYIKHNLYADFFLNLRDYSKSFLVTDSQFKMNEISHCLNFNSLLLKHELQTFHLQYTCVLQSISSLIILIYTTVFLSYINNVFD